MQKQIIKPFELPLRIDPLDILDIKESGRDPKRRRKSHFALASLASFISSLAWVIAVYTAKILRLENWFLFFLPKFHRGSAANFMGFYILLGNRNEKHQGKRTMEWKIWSMFTGSFKQNIGEISETREISKSWFETAWKTFNELDSSSFSESVSLVICICCKKPRNCY